MHFGLSDAMPSSPPFASTAATPSGDWHDSQMPPMPRSRSRPQLSESAGRECGLSFVGRGLQKLAVPFLADGDEDEYALRYEPDRQPLRVVHLMGIAFFAVAGSANGIEETVAAGGPFLAVAALLVAPLLWSAPMLMVVSELSVALPHSGGYVVWVNAAFGPLPALLNGT